MDYEILRGKQTLESLESDWDRLWQQAHMQSFYLTYDMAYAQLNFCRFAPEDVMFVRFFDQGRTVAICPLCLSRRGRVLKLKSLEILRTHLAPLRSCLVHRDYVEPVARKLAEVISRDFPWRHDVVTLESISPADDFMNLLEAELVKHLGLYYRQTNWSNVVVRVDQGQDAEGLFRSKNRKLRESLVRFINRLGKEGWWDIVVLSKPGPELDRGMDDFCAVYDKAWQKQRDPDFHRKMAQRMAEKDMLRLFVLYFRPGHPVPKQERNFQSYKSEVADHRPIPPDCLPIATQLTYRMGDTVQLVRTAYDQDYRRMAPGKVLQWFAFKYYLDRGGISLFDMEAGDEGYKRDWGEVREHRHIFQVARPFSWRALIEVPAEKHLVPLIRRIMRRPSK